MPRGAFFRGLVFQTRKYIIRTMSIDSYIKDTKSELKHVTWPSKEQTINFTAVVIGLSIFVGVLLGVFDFIFTSLLKIFL